MAIDPDDDLGTAQGPFKVVACIPVHGRLPLLELNIKRLYEKNGVYKVICAGDGVKEKNLCDSLGVVWVEKPNEPLGDKWNAAFYAAKKFKPDAVLFVGSSDLICDDWIHIMRPYVKKYDYVGTAGCSMADLGKTIRAVHWPGYEKNKREDRTDEAIGIGRMLSRRLMDKLHWKPFRPDLNGSLDASMKLNAKRFGFKNFIVREESLKSLSVSCRLWPNKHNFEDHWENRLTSHKIAEPEKFLQQYFPEVLGL